ncbi:MAG: PDGLE domain-containing protein [Anaerolineales bacterium]
MALIVALFSPLASASPDGLEFVAEQNGFLDRALDPTYSILPDYTVPFIAHPVLTTIVAVALGTLLVFMVAWFVGRNTTRSEAAGD